MNNFDQELQRRLETLRARGLYRELRRLDSPQSPHIQVAGRALVNFSSNDYLGLANHPALKQAAREAVETHGVGAGASRLICGTLAPHVELEETLARFKGTEAALAFSSGYAAAVGTISALMSRDDVVLVDQLVHASLIDAVRLSGAQLRVFAHNDPADLERRLRWMEARRPVGSAAALHRRTLAVTESVFSMDGDFAPLRELVEVKDRFGAWLLVDEAHATGLYGSQRRGWAEACGVADRIELQMGTMSKALGVQGGYLCGSRTLIEYLIHRARSFVFSTAPVPAAVAAATAALRLVQSDEGRLRCQRLWDNARWLRRAGLPFLPLASVGPEAVQPQPEAVSAILPLRVGDEGAAMNLAAALREAGYFIPAIRYPTVARGQARLRLTVTADHTPEDLQGLQAALCRLAPGGSES